MTLVWSKKYLRFLILALLSCTLSACLRYENIWDLINYHYYSGFAFLAGRAGYDLAPAVHHSYFNPLLDSLVYLAMRALNDKPAVYYFFAGLPYACALFLVSLAADRVFDASRSSGIWAALACLAISATGYGMFFQIGASTHEITVACFVFGALLLLLKTLFFKEKTDVRLIFAAGAVLGAAAGLKMSVNMYCLSTGVTLILFYKRLDRPVVSIAAFIVAGVAGWLLTNGFWAWHLWDFYGNPFGVFFNKVFKSPYFGDFNYSTTEFMEKHRFYDVFLLPFYFIHYVPSMMKTEASFFTDFRWIVALLILSGMTVYGIQNKKNPLSPPVFFLSVWLAVSYFVWATTVSVVRYAVPMEMVVSILFVVVFLKIPFKSISEKSVAAAIGMMLMMSTVILSEPHWTVQHSSKIIDAEDPVFPDDTLMILFGDPLSAYVARAAEKAKVRSVTVSALFPVPFSFPETGRFAYQREAIFDDHKGPVVALIRTDFFTKWIMSAFAYRLASAMQCRPFRQQISEIEVLICVFAPPENESE